MRTFGLNMSVLSTTISVYSQVFREISLHSCRK